jgi:putative phosphoesterase
MKYNSPGGEDELKIAVTGDTHGQINKVIKAIKKHQADAIIFTGDYIRDAKHLSKQLQLPVYAVAGNCDPPGAGELEKQVELAGKKLFITHGHRLGVKRGLQSLYYRTQEVEAQVAVFGHTHTPFCKNVEGTWLINPGSPTYPRGLSLKGTYVIITVENDKFYPVVWQL